MFICKKVMRSRFRGNRQHGAALVISLIILLVMTLIGVSSLQTTTFEEKMTGNIRDKAMAFEAGEAALREAETFIEDNIETLGDFDSNGTDGLYNKDIEKIWEQVDWEGTDSGNTNDALTSTTIPGTATAPKYVIQHYASYTLEADQYNLDNYGQGTGAGEIHMFRITVRGTGGSNNAVAILQSTYGKVF